MSFPPENDQGLSHFHIISSQDRSGLAGAQGSGLEDPCFMQLSLTGPKLHSH